MKNEKYADNNEAEARGVVPLDLFTEIKDREDGEHRQGDDLLNGLQLRGGEFVRTNAIRRYLEAVLEERDAPADHNHFPESGGAELQVAVPRKGHEDVRDGEQKDGSHVL